MARISKMNRKAFVKLLNNKKPMKKRVQAQPKVNSVDLLKLKRSDAESNAILRNKAREMLKGILKYDLKVGSKDSKHTNYRLSLEGSIWAPWSKLARGGK